MACWAHGWPKIFKVQQSSESPVATDAEKKIAELGLLACSSAAKVALACLAPSFTLPGHRWKERVQ